MVIRSAILLEQDMNERIEKLAELSGFKQDMFNIGIWHSPEFQKFAERFAELIVKECQLRVERYINDCGEVNSIPDTVILEHFGVKE